MRDLKYHIPGKQGLKKLHGNYDTAYFLHCTYLVMPYLVCVCLLVKPSTYT